MNFVANNHYHFINTRDFILFYIFIIPATFQNMNFSGALVKCDYIATSIYYPKGLRRERFSNVD